MISARSIPVALCEAAAQGDHQRGFTFVDEAGESFYSFEDLAGLAAKYAAAMLREGLQPGDRVALALPDSTEFVFAFLGAMHAGLVPVPMYPPLGFGKLGFYLTHARHILDSSGASLLITSAQVKSVLGSLLQKGLRSIRTVTELGIDDRQVPVANLRSDAPAFLQFTSGSTSQPKGVILTHGSLSANARCIVEGLHMTPADVGCSWLPLYHDMGLIGFVLTPIMNCTPTVLMPPFMFLKRPIEWLRQMSRHRATISFAPNFGYGLCASRVRDRDRESLDLSNWRVAGCGSEPIQIATLETFSARFASVGFNHKAFVPAYGLAENTLAVSFSPLASPPRAERVLLKTLSSDAIAHPVIDRDEVADRQNDSVAVTVVSTGRAFADHEIAILGRDGSLCEPRTVGEIVVRGPSMMSGYYNNPAATRTAIRNGWLHTGDLGFLIDQELFVCGRIKDLIIIAGRNYYPSDIESIVSEIPGVRRGRVVAFGLDAAQRQGKEGVVICVESKVKESGREALAEQVKSLVLQVLGLKVDEIVQLGRGSLPRTSSGKLQRNKTRELYLSGKLETAGHQEGKLVLLWHLTGSQWGFFKKRVSSVVTGQGG
jgi:fatty-acyl-CoA synthase